MSESLLKDRMTEALDSIDFPLSSSRHNIMRGGVAKQGFVLGRVRTWGGGLQYDPRQFRPSRKTTTNKYKGIWELGKKLMNTHDPNFKWTSIQFNKNNRTAKHKDANNVGESYMLGLGNYTGGDLLIFDEDGKNPKQVNTKGWIKFNGSIYPHETMPFTGNRYTLVFYKV